MFESLKGMAGMAGMLKDMPRIKAKIAELRERLARTTVEAESGGGAVWATVTGELILRGVRIKDSILSALVQRDGANRNLAEELITEAVNGAMDKAREMVKQAMMQAAEDLDLPIPPGALAGGLGGMLS
jgi:hypothetical protein